MTTVTDTLDDIAVTAVLVLALSTPGGVTVPAAAAALGRAEAWVRWQVGADRPSDTITAVEDLRTGAIRYRYAHLVVTDTTLIAGALMALTEHGWTQGTHEDALDRVDITGALRLAAGVHPEETPDDPHILDALLAAEDRLAGELGHGPTAVDAGETVAAWQDDPTRTIDEIRALLTTAATR
ncbi:MULTISPECIES: DUF6197 family protein [Frankia]|uniref:Uncharacterized protein n=1 Tax=Candidatus Frankia alpina TaxID=2699483 RepID=A0A4S5ER99_9ACTN|nr:MULTISPECIES: hypothetical protein [Frankia]THJ74934.1 hypothetical protein E7Y31_08435 [Candidatus Frankia alpina]